MTSTKDLVGQQTKSDRWLSNPDRRAVIGALAAAPFVLAFDAPSRGTKARGPNLPLAAGGGLRAAAGPRFNAFLAIGSDNVTTVITGQTEGGQGISTGIPQILAAELGADWALTQCQFSTELLAEFINPVLYSGLVLTAGSSSISAFFGTYRRAAATVREMLVTAAARRWNVPFTECIAENSYVVHPPSRRRASFGSLAPAAKQEPVPDPPRLRPFSELPLIGQRISRIDAGPKSTGSARFGIDLGPPDMLYAAVRHGRAHGSAIDRFDDTLARTMPGVKLVMAVPQGVAVVAEHYWQAVKALEKVTEAYAPSPNDNASSATLMAVMQSSLEGGAGVPTPGGRGDVPAALTTAATVIEADYWQPILCHASIEPVTCTASVTEGRCELWLSTKSPTLDGRHAAAASGVDLEQVVIHNEYQGGDFGRRSGREHVTEAILLSMAVRRPVKVIWSREEDIRMDQHRTAILGRARLGLDAKGMPVAYDARIAADGAWRQLFPWWYARNKPLDLPQFNLAGSAYAIANERGTYALAPHPVGIGAFRGNNEAHNNFILECILDEAAHRGGYDPLAYRRTLLAHDNRSLAVLDRAAELAGWRTPQAGHGFGIAYHCSKDTYHDRQAMIVEVVSKPDGVSIRRIVLVCDSGLVINPLLAERSLEGGIVFGLSNCIYEEITLADGAPEQRNYDDYRLLRMNEVPEIVVETLSVGEIPGSFGEVGTFPVGAALANAIFAATGRRLRRQPFARNIDFF